VITFNVVFEPAGIQGQSVAGETLLDVARKAGVGIVSICRDRGTCRKCRVRIVKGTASSATDAERKALTGRELEEGWRLACQAYPASDCTISVPLESLVADQRSQVEGLEVDVTTEPSVRSVELHLEAPSLTDPRADADRVLDALRTQHGLLARRMDIGVLQGMSSKLREWGWRCRAAVRLDEVIAVGRQEGKSLGLAVDLGTTKIAGYLLDLETGRTLAARGVANPQAAYGGDVISRIDGTIRAPGEAAQLQSLVADDLNRMAREMCQETGSDTRGIVDAVVVGNTAMHHLFLGLPVRQLASAPFVPAASGAIDVKARDVGLELAPGAYVHLLPNIAGFVGGDHVAMLLAVGFWRKEELVVALDIGTNTEVALTQGGRITSVSCASGPAFEGGHIKHGMRAARGAIERVRIDGNSVDYQTIEDAAPVGVCGSGILDAIAQLCLAGVVDPSGRMHGGHPRVRTEKGIREFVLVYEDASGTGQPIVVTQQDVRELQMAKAAMRAGIQALLDATGHKEEDIKQVVIAGAFGSYIDIESACAIGMLPSLPLERFRQVGNAAGTGARLALLSSAKRAEAQDIASRARYIELASAPNFMRIFADACSLRPGRLQGRTRNERKGNDG